MNWQSNKGFVAKEYKAFGENAWGQKVFVIKYKGFLMSQQRMILTNG